MIRPAGYIANLNITTLRKAYKQPLCGQRSLLGSVHSFRIEFNKRYMLIMSKNAQQF
jgi:hypothetical protein